MEKRFIEYEGNIYRATVGVGGFAYGAKRWDPDKKEWVPGGEGGSKAITFGDTLEEGELPGDIRQS